MTPSTLLSPLLTYCTDFPGFSPDAIEVAETEQRIGTMLSTLHHWERSAVEWRERAEGLHARAAELEREVARLTAERDRYKAWHDGVAIQLTAARADSGDADITLYGAGLRYAELIVRPQPLKENE